MRVLPVSVTVPPEGVSTPLLGSLALAEAAEVRTTELSARPATAAATNPVLSRVVPINLITGFLLVRWLVRCCAGVNLML
jgi:hypothetical protein